MPSIGAYLDYYYYVRSPKLLLLETPDYFLVLAASVVIGELTEGSSVPIKNPTQTTVTQKLT